MKDILEGEDGEWIYAAKQDNGEIILFDENLTIVERIESYSCYRCSSELLFIGGCKGKLVSCGDEGIQIVDMSTSPHNIKSNDDILHINALCLLYDNRIAAGGKDLAIYILDENGELLHKYNTEMEVIISCLLYIEETGTIWIGDGSNQIFILELETDEIHQLIQNVHDKEEYMRMNLVEGDKENIFSVGPDGKVGVWGYDETLLFSFNLGGECHGSSLLFAYDSLISGDQMGNVEMWKVTPTKQTQIVKFKPHERCMLGKSIHTIGEESAKLLITTSYDKTIKILDPLHSQILKDFETDQKISGMTKVYKDLVLYYGMLIYIYIYINIYIIYVDIKMVRIWILPLKIP